MSAATILFTDIVCFSKKPTAEQRRLVETLTSEVIRELRVLLKPPLDAPSILALPTGDGLALAFLHKQNQQWNLTTVLRLILSMHQWAHNQSTINNAVKLRIGIHVGPVELITDINGNPNICGDTVNYTQRVMDASNPCQTLFSDAAYREYIGTESSTYTMSPFSEKLQAEFKGPIEVYAKHGLQILVYKLVLNPSQLYWSNEDPIAKQLMIVSLTPLPKNISGPFSEKIQKATQIALIQLTGERFLENSKNIKLSNDLKRFWVFMPNPKIYATSNLATPHVTARSITTNIAQWKKYFMSLKTTFPTADFKLGLFKEPPYFGASFINWEHPGGKIHVSPYIWNVLARYCPGYDLEWIGKNPSVVYETYVEGLQYLNKITNNELRK